MNPRRILSLLAAATALVLASCAGPQSEPAATSRSAEPARAAVTPAPPPTAAAPAAPLAPAPFTEAIARAGEKLLADAQAVVGSGPRCQNERGGGCQQGQDAAWVHGGSDQRQAAMLRAL